jgi:hypothetical protein
VNRTPFDAVASFANTHNRKHADPNGLRGAKFSSKITAFGDTKLSREPARTKMKRHRSLRNRF